MEKIKLAVIGDPIDHSLSPELHNYWFKMKGMKDATYEKIKVPKVYLLSFLKNLAKEGFQGVNITLPLKEEAYLILKEIGTVCPMSEKAKAVNTVAVREGELYGYNTDVSGFYNSLVKNIPSDFDVRQKVTLVIGAGGAARAVLAAFAMNGISKVVIANRTVERAEKMRDELLPSAKVIPLDQINKIVKNVDLIVNTVSIGIITGKKLEINLNVGEKELICYDIIYKPYFTDFLRDAKHNGHYLVHGLSMLIEQGAGSFKHWFGDKPEITNDLIEYMSHYY
jgi:shikimate dehydrogenase